MRRKRNLDSLETLAQGNESRWRRHVTKQLGSLQAEEERLAQLHDYVREYNAPLNQRQGSQSILAMRSQRQFVDRLKDAVRQQSRTVDERRASAEQGIQRWKHERSRRMAIEKFSARQREAEERQRDRRDQATLDEVGRNLFLKRSK